MPSSGAISIGRIVCVAPVSTSEPTAGRDRFLYLNTTGTSGSQLPPYGTYSNRIYPARYSDFGTRSRRISAFLWPFTFMRTVERRGSAAHTFPPLLTTHLPPFFLEK